MRDQRGDALAQILVEYRRGYRRATSAWSRATTTAEPLVPGRLRGDPPRGRASGRAARRRAAAAPPFYAPRRRRPARLDPAARHAGRPSTPTCRIAILGAETNARALSSADKRGPRPAGAAAALMETLDASFGRGRVPLGRHAVPHPCLRAPRRGCSSPTTRTSTTPPAWRRRRSASRPGSAPSDEVKRLADWIEGQEEVHITAPGTDITLGVAGRTFIPASATHNMPDGEFFTGPVEDSVNGEVTLPLPATLSAAARSPACASVRGRQGRRRHAPTRRGVPDRDARHRRGRAPPRRARDRHQLRHHRRHQEILLDEKIGGTVHLAIGASYPETGGANESAVHWDMICDLRKGGSVDGRRRGPAARREVRRLALAPGWCGHPHGGLT